MAALGTVKETDSLTMQLAGKELEFQTHVVGEALPTKMYYAIDFRDGIAYQIQVPVQIGIGHIRPRKSKVQAGGDTQCRLVHTADHHFQVGGPGSTNTVTVKRIGEGMSAGGWTG